MGQEFYCCSYLGQLQGRINERLFSFRQPPPAADNITFVRRSNDRWSILINDTSTQCFNVFLANQVLSLNFNCCLGTTVATNHRNQIRNGCRRVVNVRRTGPGLVVETVASFYSGVEPLSQNIYRYLSMIGWQQPLELTWGQQKKYRRHAHHSIGCISRRWNWIIITLSEPHGSSTAVIMPNVCVLLLVQAGIIHQFISCDTQCLSSDQLQAGGNAPFTEVAIEREAEKLKSITVGFLNTIIKLNGEVCTKCE